MEKNNHYTYETAFEELQKIVKIIDQGDVPIDELSEYIQRATALVKVCEAKLNKTEKEVQVMLKQLEENPSENVKETKNKSNSEEE